MIATASTPSPAPAPVARTVATVLPDLPHFSGSETFTRHAIARAVLYTEGVAYVAEAAGAHWLVDTIALSQGRTAALKGQPFQVWKLSIAAARATIVVEDGNEGELLRIAVGPTDFPEPGITLWCVDGTILLPGEY